MRLYLWKVERTDDVGWDEFAAAIVAARTEKDARQIHPNGEGSTPDKWSVQFSDWPVTPESLTVTKLGTAAQGIEPGAVLLADFKAG